MATDLRDVGTCTAPYWHTTAKGDAHAVDDLYDLSGVVALETRISYALGGFIHLMDEKKGGPFLLVIAVVVLVIRLIHARGENNGRV